MKSFVPRISLFSLALAASMLAAGNVAIGEENLPAQAAPAHVSFTDLDSNQDGRLSHDEAVADADLAAHFEGADRNWDGALNAAEYRTLKAAVENNQLDLLPDDNTVTAKVQDKLAQALKARQSRIHVDTYKGEVFLTGYVDTESHSRRAVELARTVTGVAAVKNGLIAKG